MTKQEYTLWVEQYEAHVKELQAWIKEAKKSIKKMPDEGEVSTNAEGGIETPPKPPPNP